MLNPNFLRILVATLFLALPAGALAINEESLIRTEIAKLGLGEKDATDAIEALGKFPRKKSCGGLT